MDAELKDLRIERSNNTPRPVPRWMVPGVAVVVLLSAAGYVYAMRTAAPEVETLRVRAPSSDSDGAIILNATGYIVAAHKIELASKVVGKVAWIGVEKGDHVAQGQELVRLEDDEYRARLLEAQGQLENLEARL